MSRSGCHETINTSQEGVGGGEWEFLLLFAGRFYSGADVVVVSIKMFICVYVFFYCNGLELGPLSRN